MSKQTMGEFLALLRRANGFTQQDVADKLNISNRTLSSWETDRTTPDILLLPAIADLYGVTVDELLRCERGATTNSDRQISEEALQSKRKHRLGKFSAKSLLLSGLGCFGAVMIALSFILWLYAGCPTWLFILLIVLSACDIVVCGVILFYLYYNAKVAEGLVLKEDYTEEKKPYALALKRKSAKFFLFCTLPLIVFAVIMIIVAVIIQPTNFEILGVEFNIVGAYIATICTTGILGIAFLIAYFVYANVNFLGLANETQVYNYKCNAKLLGKTAGFGAIPVAVCMVLAIVFSFTFPTNYGIVVSADTTEDFKRQMQIITITEEEQELFNKPAGDYYLDFPEYPTSRTVYDLGNGFCGIYNAGFLATDNLWYIYVLKSEELPVANEYGYIDHDELVYSNIIFEGRYVYTDFGDAYVVTFHFKNEHYTVYHGLGIAVTSELKATQYYGKYIYAFEDTLYLDSFFLYIFLIITSITIITATTIYLVKRKKQIYNL